MAFWFLIIGLALTAMVLLAVAFVAGFAVGMRTEAEFHDDADKQLPVQREKLP